MFTEIAKKLFGAKNLAAVLRANTAEKNAPGTAAKCRPHTRRLCIEPLESRELLSVSVDDFRDIVAMYPELNLTKPLSSDPVLNLLANMETYNIIEITAAQLETATRLQDALTAAKNTSKPDLIVVRTTATYNKITLSGTELAIQIPELWYGSVTIVSLGTERLTIDANNKSRILSVAQTSLNLGGINFINGYAGTTNSSQDSGGAINASVLPLSLSLAHVEFKNNTAYSGGGLYVAGSVTLNHVSFVGNHAKTDAGSTQRLSGGGLYVAAGGTQTTLKDVAFVNNSTVLKLHLES